jgi:hypothetical protein
MNIPAFTADASLYRSRRHYHASPATDSESRTHTIVPALQPADNAACDECNSGCGKGAIQCTATASASYVAALIGCAASGPLYPICAGAASAVYGTAYTVCIAASWVCLAECELPGNACCPTHCEGSGSGYCCSTGEQCSSSDRGCCPVGRQVCGGRCCPEGDRCCGDECCSARNCCNGVCCEGECDPNGDCCSSPSHVCGGSCCPPFNKCCNNECCGAYQQCHPTLGTCWTPDDDGGDGGQNFCSFGREFCFGKCCPSGEVCCGRYADGQPNCKLGTFPNACLN